ncbi:hypothetical protein BH11PSE7_BH11PSE7_12290 [soil metagenome]
MSKPKDENEIAHRILRTVLLGGTGTKDERNGRLGGLASVAAVSPQDRSLNGLKGALARWGHIRGRDNIPTMPRKDANQTAFSILQQATGEAPKPEETARQENGRKGGIKGGASRAAKLTPEQRAEIARTAALVRWKKSP